MTAQILSTGWFSTEEERNYQVHGDEINRSPEFRGLWWDSVNNNVEPQKVLIVDSKSPVKAIERPGTKVSLDRIEFTLNPGHSQNCTGHYCGYVGSFLMGLEYTLFCDADYFLYVEQDVLIKGKGFVSRIERQLHKSGIVFGNGGKGLVETSVVAIRKDLIRKFIARLHLIDFSDKNVPPELKFMYIASRANWLPLSLAAWNRNPILRRAYTKLLLWACHGLANYELLDFGYGRQRPLNFADEVFYFQHATRDEISTYKKMTGFGSVNE